MSAHAPILLGVNVDHVATLRQARGTRYPDPVTAAMIAEGAGADSITIHVEVGERVPQLLWKIRSLGLKVGLAVNPQTGIANIQPY